MHNACVLPVDPDMTFHSAVGVCWSQPVSIAYIACCNVLLLLHIFFCSVQHDHKTIAQYKAKPGGCLFGVIVE